MLENKQCGIVFDMDGVIIDTCKLHEESWFNISRIHNYKWDEDINFKEDIFGTSSTDSVRLLFGHNVSDININKICAEKEEIFKEILKKHINYIVMNGFADFLNIIVKARIPLALATSAAREEADFVLNSLNIRKYFKSVTSISNVKNPKPDPEIYFVACKALGVPPDRCLGFEDSIFGVAALNRAGMRCIVVGSTMSYDKLLSSGLEFDCYIKDFRDLTMGSVYDILVSDTAVKAKL